MSPAGTTMTELDPDVSAGAGTASRLPWMLLLLVLIGGMAGTLARASLTVAFPTGSGFPMTVFIINLGGAFILGFLLDLLGSIGPDSGIRIALRLGLGTGFCGGFTTYSTLAVDTSGLLVTHPWMAITYSVGTILAGAILTGLGMLVGAYVGRRARR